MIKNHLWLVGYLQKKEMKVFKTIFNIISYQRSVKKEFTELFQDIERIILNLNQNINDETLLELKHKIEVYEGYSKYERKFLLKEEYQDYIDSKLYFKINGLLSKKIKYPKIANEWNYNLNKDEPNNHTFRSGDKKHWICSCCNYNFESKISQRIDSKGFCPNCKKRFLK